MRVRWGGFFVAVVAFAAALIGCNSTSTSVVTQQAPSVTTARVQTGPSPVAVSLPAISTGHSATLTIPVETSGSNAALQISLQAALPSGLPSPAAIARRPANVTGQLTPLVYLGITPTANVSFNSIPAFTFTLPPGQAVTMGASALLAMFDPTNTAKCWQPILGAGTINGNTVSFPSFPQQFTLSANVNYWFVLLTTTQSVTSGATCGGAPVVVATLAPAPIPSPTPIDSNHVALQFVIDPSSQAGPPCINPSNVNFYILTGGQYVKDPQGDLVALSSGGATAAPIPFYGQGITGGNVSQVIQLPNMSSARVYMVVNGTLGINPAGTAGYPQPWTLAPGQNLSTIFDWFEFTLPANGKPTPSIDINATQIQMIGLDYTIQLNGTQKGLSKSGLLNGFMNQVHQNSPGAPWANVMYAQWPTRVLGPNAVQYSPGGNCSLTGFLSPCNPPSGTPYGGQWLDASIFNAWTTWQAPQCMQITYNAQFGPNNMNPSVTPVFGQVDGNGNFNFYDPAVVTKCSQVATAPASAIVATLPSPFNVTTQTANNQLSGCGNTSTSWFTATSSVLLQSGPFSGPTPSWLHLHRRSGRKHPRDAALPSEHAGSAGSVSGPRAGDRECRLNRDQSRLGLEYDDRQQAAGVPGVQLRLHQFATVPQPVRCDVVEGRARRLHAVGQRAAIRSIHDSVRRHVRILVGSHRHRRAIADRNDQRELTGAEGRKEILAEDCLAVSLRDKATVVADEREHLGVGARDLRDREVGAP